MKDKFRVIYIGNFFKVPEFIIHEDAFKLDKIICEKEKFTDELLTFSLVRGIPVHFFEDLDLKKELRILKENIDFFIMCSFGRILPSWFVKSLEGYNIHYSYLPFYKGRHPTFWATVNGEKSLGITLHKVSSYVDGGEIISQKKVPYFLWENENDVFSKLTNLIPLLLKDLLLYKKGLIKPKENHPQKFYFRPVGERDYTIDIENDTPEVIFNKVRAQSRYRGAKLIFNNKIYWVRKVLFTNRPSAYEGKVLVPVRSGEYYLVLLEFDE